MLPGTTVGSVSENVKARAKIPCLIVRPSVRPMHTLICAFLVKILAIVPSSFHLSMLHAGHTASLMINTMCLNCGVLLIAWYGFKKDERDLHSLASFTWWMSQCKYLYISPLFLNTLFPWSFSALRYLLLGKEGSSVDTERFRQVYYICRNWN